jgi:GNAT superfamily N-acetyltransferase
VLAETQQAKPDGLTIRPLEAGDLAAMSELFRAAFGLSRPASYEEWRYFRTPWGVTPGMVALDGERAIASYTVWPVWLDVGGRVVRGGQSMDTMTHPDYRGRGVFLRLAKVYAAEQ